MTTPRRVSAPVLDGSTISDYASTHRRNRALRQLELMSSLRDERTVRVRKNHMLEMLRRAGVVASSPQQPRPLELGLRRFGRGALAVDDSLPKRDRRRVVLARRFDLGRREEQ